MPFGALWSFRSKNNLKQNQFIKLSESGAGIERACASRARRDDPDLVKFAKLLISTFSAIGTFVGPFSSSLDHNVTSQLTRYGRYLIVTRELSCLNLPLVTLAVSG